MKNIKIFAAVLICLSTATLSAQIHLTEGFEGGSKPEGWTEENVVGNEPWRYRNGGHSPNDNNWQVPPDAVDITRNPPAAAAGTYNAIFFKQGTGNEKTKLITPELDVLGATSLELTFQLCQIPWTFEGSTGWDVLRVYYKVSADDPWVLIHEYLDRIYEWEEQKLALPNPSETYYVAFEGHTRWGYGTCIDEIQIEETGLQPMYVGDINFEQSFSNFVPSGASEVPMMRIDFKVFGNTDSVELEYIHFNSRNTSDDDLLPNGVKLFATTSQTFETSTPLGSPTNFSSGVASFTGLNHILPAGSSYLWVTYDIDPDATHENILDLMVSAGSIRANGQLYPETNEEPEGYKEIYRTRYFEDFEGGHNWTLTGEFEVAAPSGLGGGADAGNPDPPSAFSGTMALGTDLTGLGVNHYNYEPSLSETDAYLATSPNVNVLYYKNLNLFFRRYLNIEVWDDAFIEISTDDGASWNILWESSYFTDFQWTEERLIIPQEYTRTDLLKIRFRLGPTSGFNNYSGWNIDDIYLTGEFISKDVGVSEWLYPQSGSGHSANDSVVVRIRNYGGAEITDPVPVAYSFDGGTTWTIDQMSESIPVGGFIDFTFPTRVDLTEPGLRPSVLAKTVLPGDQFTGNDQMETEVFILPTLLPPYVEDFEDGDGAWRSMGNGIWQNGVPEGNTINSAASGGQVWATGLSDRYGDMLSDVNQIIFEDNFETDQGWSFVEEFERANPSNIYLPYFAYSGLYLIGTDLSGLGSQKHYYENGIVPGKAYTATSPAIDVSQFSKLRINFASWISVQAGDSIRIEVSDDNGDSWQTLWQNTEGAISEWDYQIREVFIPDSLTFTAQMKIRFSLFYTSAGGPVAEGWFIDDVQLIGDYVESEAAYLNSPSFDLRGMINPMITAYLWMDSEQDVDGTSLQYSLDNGQSWINVSNSSGYDSQWNWYTGHPVSALGTSGWSGQSDEWTEVRHLLPAPVQNQADVQFRFVFSADKSNNHFDGTGFDDIQIIEAPADIDLIEIVDPQSDCELSAFQRFTLRLKNTGLSALQPGDSIHIGYQIDHEDLMQWDEEVYTLSQVWPAGTTLDFLMNQEFDFSRSGIYTSTVYAISTDPHFYKTISNDTLIRSLEVNKPKVDLGEDISTVRPDTVVLRAYSGVPGQTYLWQDGSQDSLFNVSTDGTYYVEVENSLRCIASDTIRVLQLVADVGVVAYAGPASACEINGAKQLIVSIENLGTDTVEIGEPISIGGIINSGAPFEDAVVLSERFKPGMSFEHTYSGTFDFSSPGEYSLKLYTRMGGDLEYSNDTLFHILYTYGYPDADLGPDTVVQDASYLLEPGTGYFEYLWQDGSSTENYLVTQGGTGQYYVRIDDGNGCISHDTVVVSLNILDLAIDELLSPSTSCELSSSIRVSARISNAGNQTISSGESVMLGYRIDGNPKVTEETVLSQDLLPGHTFNFTFSNSESVQTGLWYDFSVFVDYSKDSKTNNDTIITSVGVFETPVLELGDSYQVVTGTEHTLDAGPGFVHYEWQDGSTDQTFTITQPGIGKYYVTVTDENGCTAYDEVDLLLAVPDVGVLAVNNPVSTCRMGETEFVRISIQNFGTYEIGTDADITISYSINGSNEVSEKLLLNEPFENGTVIEHTFENPEDLSVPGTYDIFAYTTFAEDLVPSNDMVLVSADHYGSPEIQIGDGSDSILIYEPITLEVTPDYPDYEWQDGSSGTEYQISSPSAAWYRVTVTAENGCATQDSVFVAYDHPDLGILSLASPVSACELDEYTVFALEIVNNGFTPIEAGDTLTMTYSVNGGSSVFEVLILEEELPWGEAKVFTFSEPYDLSSEGLYNIQASLLYPPDLFLDNNLLFTSVENWEAPGVEINGGADTLKGDLPLTLDAGTGYASYLWSDNSSSSSIQANSFGTYWVMVTDQHGCAAYDSIRVSSITSDGDILLSSGQVKIYPNPVHDLLKVEINLEMKKGVRVELYTMANNLVYLQDLEQTLCGEVKIDVQDLVPGPYFLRIYTDEVPHHFMVVVQ